MFGGDKARLIELETENRLLSQRVEELKTEKQELLDKLDRAYEAITAKEAPAAYSDLKAEQAEASLTDEQKASRDKMRDMASATGLLMEAMEGPVFRNVEDMQDLLRGVEQTGPPKIESIHGNEES